MATINKIQTNGTTYDIAVSGANVSGAVASAGTLTGLTATVTELNYVDGVTSNIQTQINDLGKSVADGKQMLAVTISEYWDSEVASDATFAELDEAIIGLADYQWNGGYSEGTNDGYRSGYSEGSTDGYDEGYSDGYDEGYTAGENAGTEVVNSASCYIYNFSCPAYQSRTWGVEDMITHMVENDYWTLVVETSTPTDWGVGLTIDQPICYTLNSWESISGSVILSAKATKTSSPTIITQGEAIMLELVGFDTLERDATLILRNFLTGYGETLYAVATLTCWDGTDNGPSEGALSEPEASQHQSAVDHLG